MLVTRVQGPFPFKPRQAARFIHRLIPNLSSPQILHILNSKLWPHKSFIQVAHTLGLTIPVKLKQEDLTIIRKIEQLEDSAETLLRTIEDETAQLRSLRRMPDNQSTLNKLELKEKTDKLQTLFKKVYFKLAKGPKSDRLREVMNKARCLLPKAFFASINTHTKLNSKGKLM